MGYLARIVFLPSLFLVAAMPVKAGQVADLSTTDAAGRVTVHSYDASGLIMSTTDPRGVRSYPGPNPLGSGARSAMNDTSVATTPIPAMKPATIHVPGDQPTIQAAINAAADGDIVLVADGQYTENINFSGKAIRVTSVHGASKTTIDGGAVASVVTFNTNEGAGSVLSGFTITNGFTSFQGGGVYVGGAAPTIMNNIVTKNAGCEGAGVAVQGGGPLIQANIISSNFQAGCSGGTGGGGIGLVAATTSGTPTRIIGNTIADNSMLDSGIGGGGISLFAAGAPVIRNNIIVGNNGGNAGGGLVTVNDSSPQIVQNLFIHNTAGQGGGIQWLIPVSTPGLVLVNNTIAENPSAGGSAIFDGGFDTNMTIENNLIIGRPGQAAYFCQQFNGSTTPAVFSNNDVFASGGAAISGNCTVAAGINGNISLDPQFVGASERNLHLQSDSPAIDAGSNSAPDLPLKDLNGFRRIENKIVDIGAYEFFPSSVSIKPSSLAFATQLIGSQSTAQSVEVVNSGTVPLFLGVTITGDFLQTDNCPTHLAAQASCVIMVSFRPTAKGARSGELLLSDNAAVSPQRVLLTGTGT